MRLVGEGESGRAAFGEGGGSWGGGGMVVFFVVVVFVVVGAVPFEGWGWWGEVGIGVNEEWEWALEDVFCGGRGGCGGQVGVGGLLRGLLGREGVFVF